MTAQESPWLEPGAEVLAEGSNGSNSTRSVRRSPANPTGFAKVPHWVIRDSGISAKALLLYIALAGRANAAGECWPSIALLAAEARSSANTIRSARDELRDAGLLTWQIRREENGLNRPHVYRLNMGKQRSESAVAKADESGATTEGGGSTSAPPVVQPVRVGGSVVAPEVDTEKQIQERRPKEVDTRLKPSFFENRPQGGFSDWISATDAQLQFLRDCFVMVHSGVPGEDLEARWANSTSAAIDIEIKEFWPEVESAQLGDVLRLRHELSPRAISFLEKRLSA